MKTTRHKYRTQIPCPHCNQELVIDDEDRKEVFIYQQGTDTIALCCGNKIFIKPVLKMIAEKS